MSRTTRFPATRVRASLLLTTAIVTAAALQATGSQADSQETQPAAKRRGADPAYVEVEDARIQFDKHAVLAAAQAGVLKRVAPEEGTAVKAGEIVAELVDGVAQAQYKIAVEEAGNRVDIEYAKKAAELAANELDKANEVNREAPRTVPDIEVQKFALAADRARLQIKLAEHEHTVKQLTETMRKAELDAYGVKAPFEGVVTSVFKHAGEAVRQGDPILEMANPRLLRAEAKVALKDALAIKAGDRVEIHLDLPGVPLRKDQKVFHGTVAFVDISVNPVNRSTVRVWARVENAGNVLRAGQLTRMRIFPGTH